MQSTRVSARGMLIRSSTRSRTKVTEERKLPPAREGVTGQEAMMLLLPGLTRKGPQIASDGWQMVPATQPWTATFGTPCAYQKMASFGTEMETESVVHRG